MPTLTYPNLGKPVIPWTPQDLFIYGNEGYWPDGENPADGRLLQDVAATLPATTFGQPVGRALALSGGASAILPPEQWTGGANWTINPGELGASITSSSGSTNTLSLGSLTGDYVGQVFDIEIEVLSGVLVVVTSRATGPSSGLGVGKHSFSVAIHLAGAGSATVRVDPGQSASFRNLSIRPRVLALQQATAAARPTTAREPKGGRRNLLTWTEAFSNIDWIKHSGGGQGKVTDDVRVENGVSYGYYEATIGASGLAYNVTLVPGQTYTMTAEIITDVSSVQIRINQIGVGTVANTPFQSSLNGSLSLTFTVPSGAANYQIVFNTGAGGKFYIARPQLEAGNAATPYQKVTTIYDVTEAGVPDMWSLRTDGTDDLMASTATFDVNKPWYFAVCAMVDAIGGISGLASIFGLTAPTAYLGIWGRASAANVRQLVARHRFEGVVTVTPSTAAEFEFGTPFIVEAWADGSNLYCAVNGDAPRTISYSPGSSSAFVPMQLASGSQLAPTRYYDALAVQRIPSDAERAALRARWAARYLP